MFKDAVSMLHRAAPDLEDLSFPIVKDAAGSVLGWFVVKTKVFSCAFFIYGSFQLDYESGVCCLPSV